MDYFFKPGSIALIGATAKRNKVGYAIFMNLRKGFTGKIFPVNPGYKDIDGVTCYPNVSDIPEPVDLAIVFIPAARVPAVVRECSECGIPGAMIESGGFAETGREGQVYQDELKRICDQTGIRIWGPNCMGLFDAVNRRIFSFVLPAIWKDGLTPGKVSLIVQSGMLAAGFLLHNMTHGIMGISKACSLGNKVDVNECDVLEYLIEDPDTEAIGLYLESIVDGRRLVKLCDNTDKPIVVLKGGKSEKGAAAAMSHTASLAGDSAVVSSVLAHCDVVEANDFQQMMDLCRTLARYPHIRKQAPGRVAVLTYSGAAGIVSADFIEGMGHELADLAEETLSSLKGVFPEWMPVSNPIDLWPAMERHGEETVIQTAVKAVCSDPGVDAVLLHQFVRDAKSTEILSRHAETIEKTGKPMFCWLMGRAPNTLNAQAMAAKKGIPAYKELYRAVECMAAVMRIRQRPKNDTVLNLSGMPDTKLPEPLDNLLRTGTGVLDEHVSKKILSGFEIAVVDEALVSTVDEAKASSVTLGFPVVMKGLLNGEVHKTEKGLVHLDVRSKSSAADVYGSLWQTMGAQGKIVIQKTIKGDVELIAGLVRDPQFGPCVMCGLGGTLAEVLADTAFAVAPVNRTDALEMIARLKHQALLNGFRGARPVDRIRFADILVSIGTLGTIYHRIREIDLNPLIVTEGIPVAVDATIILGDEPSL
jgi:acetyltransferase